MAQNPHPFVPWLTPARRRRLYQVVVALVPLLTVAGVLTDETAPLVVALAAAVLGSTSAALHTPGDS